MPTGCLRTCCQVRDVVTTVTARITAALVCTSCALVLLPQAGPPSYYVIGLLSVLSAAVTTVSPIPQATAEFTRNFRLNEPLTSAVRDGSLLVAGPLLLLLAAAAGALGVLPAAATENAAAAAAWYNAVPAGGYVVDPGEPAVMGFRAVLCMQLWLLGSKSAVNCCHLFKCVQPISTWCNRQGGLSPGTAEHMSAQLSGLQLQWQH